jgi:hypothetical protein
VSRLLDDGVADSTLTDLVAGTVGEGMAVKFMAHRKVASQMPNPSDILSGKVTELKIKEISAMYSLVVSMCYELKDAHTKLAKGKINDWHKMADHFFKFMIDNFTPELAVMGARIAISTYNMPFVATKMPSFKEFSDRYSKYIIQRD